MRLIVPGDRTRVEEVGEFGRIYHIEAPQAPFFDRRYRLLLPHKFLPFCKTAVKEILREENPDLIEVCDKYALHWLGGLLRRGLIRGPRRPVLVGMSCERMGDSVGAFITPSEMGKRCVRFYLGFFYIPLFDYHVANSKYTADELLSAMIPRHERPVHHLPMGVDVDDFTDARWSEAGRQKLLAQFGGDTQTKILLYVGRLSPEKNLPLLIEMMQRLAGDETMDFRLLIAGDGPLGRWLENEARLRVPGRVCALGHIGDRSALIDMYANCDAYVHPNAREPFGIAPLEAMAAGLPLVAPKYGGVLSYADETNAWLAEANGEAFAGAVRDVFIDPAARKDKLARARWTAQRHKWEFVTARFFDLYDEPHRDFSVNRKRIKSFREPGYRFQGSANSP